MAKILMLPWDHLELHFDTISRHVKGLFYSKNANLIDFPYVIRSLGNIKASQGHLKNPDLKALKDFSDIVDVNYLRDVRRHIVSGVAQTE